MNHVGTSERIARILLGSALIAIVFFCPQIRWGWIGVVPLFAGLLGTCPAYSVLGVQTCKPN